VSVIKRWWKSDDHAACRLLMPEGREALLAECSERCRAASIANVPTEFIDGIDERVAK
jgi:hypothetical protein